MASYVETTAVSLRKGTTTANLQFTGCRGELVYDEGEEQGGVLGVDINATIRIHNGITKGGIPMCRADTRNISTKLLAENRRLIDDKNLAYADLSNLEVLEDDSAIRNLVNTLDEYGIVNKDFLKSETDKLALKDMSNVITSTLASGRGRGVDGNLAYADTSNINTKDLTDPALHYGKEEGDLPLAYADLSNVDTSNLTKSVEERPADMKGPVLTDDKLSNVTNETLAEKLFDISNGLNLERTIYKDNVIPEEASEIVQGNYPTTSAVNKFVKEQIEKGEFLKKNLKNIETYEPLYANTDSVYTFLVDESYILNKGSGFNTLGKSYPTNKILSSEIPVQFSFNGASLFIVTPYGGSDLDATSGRELSLRCQLSDEIDITVKAKLTATLYEGFYKYDIEVIKENEDDNPFEKLANEQLPVYFETEETIYTKQLLEVISYTDGSELTRYNYTPDTSLEDISGQVKVYSSLDDASTAATIELVCENIIPDIGPGRLLKTDLSNLLGNDSLDSQYATDNKWSINKTIPIPSIAEEEVDEKIYDKLTTDGLVFDALRDTAAYLQKQGGVPDWKAGTEYGTSPNVSKVFYEGNVYYCKEAHTAGEEFDLSKWTLLGDDTYEQLKNKDQDISLAMEDTDKYPSNKAVVDYVTAVFEKSHIPGHYYGQADIIVQTEKNLPGEDEASSEYTIQPYEGLIALVRNYNNTSEPAGARYKDGKWNFAEWDLQNGVYVYILNLGRSYNDGPGLATWNDFTKDFDIAPDKFQIPDNKTIDLNGVNGSLQITEHFQTILSYVDTGKSIQGLLDIIDSRLDKAEQRLDAAIIPAPQFFTGTNTVNQELELTDDVEFDLYVNGVFQYPNTYTFNKDTKTVTIPFAVEDTRENGIAVIYRGFRKA